MQVIDICETIKYSVEGVNSIEEKYPNESNINDELFPLEKEDGKLTEDCIITYKNGVRHSFDDKPAYKAINRETLKWYYNGVLHRENDLPAFIHNDEFKIKAWLQYDEFYRAGNKPALVIYDTRTTVAWYKNGKKVKQLFFDGDCFDDFN